MCILRYSPSIAPSASNTTAVLWHMPTIRCSNSEATTTTPASLAALDSRSVRGPGMGSARSNSLQSWVLQKYGERNNSGRQTIWAPLFAAAWTCPTAFSMLAAGSVPHCICTRPRTNSFDGIGVPAAATACLPDYTAAARPLYTRRPVLILSIRPHPVQAAPLTTRSTAVVIVNYRTPRLVVDCLRSLADEVAAEPGLRVVVADNAS